MSQTIRWQHFEPATLRSAAAANRPILLLLTAPWCQHCRELLGTTLADPAVVAAVTAQFVPVQVDAERRPDVNQRYGTGSWPTIAWLTPDGELLAHDNFLDRDRMLQTLERVQQAWRERQPEIRRGLQELWSTGPTPPAAPRARLRREMVEDIAQAIYEKFDHRHGGFGDSSKFPHPEALDFALVQASKRDDDRMREVVTITLDRMIESPVHDPVDGGFFRYSRTPDWHSPNYEKLLDQNALILRACLEAYQLFGKAQYRAAAEGIVRWMLTSMRLPGAAAFAGSQNGNADYFTTSKSERNQQTPPALDRTVYCHSNAVTVSSLLKAAVVLDQPELRQQAMATLRFLLDHLHDGRDVYHYWDGTYHLPGMLADQALLIRALIDASQHSGDADLLLPAEAIAERTIQRHKAPSGGFFDILQDPHQQGSMRRRNRSILDNATMAESLMRLSCLSRRPEFHREAVQTLESFANDYREYGYYVAGFGRAVDLVFYEPLFFTVVGDRESPAAMALRLAALSIYLPSRIVQSLDPRHDPILLGRSGYPTDTEPTAYLTIGERLCAKATTPEELRAAVQRIEQARAPKETP
jgi:uncharacterized protein YyaL (SSP411 family)